MNNEANVNNQTNVNNAPVTKKEKKKLPIGLIILLFIIIIIVIIFFLLKKNNGNLNDTGDNNGIIDTSSKEVSEITDMELIGKLNQLTLTKDKSFGFYFKNKTTINDFDNPYFIAFNIKKYIEDNNVQYKQGEVYNDDILIATISKSDLSQFIQNKYNAKGNYVLNQNPKNDLKDLVETCSNIYVDNEKYNLVTEGRVCSINYIKTKVVKATKNNNYAYIYTKAVRCGTDGTDTYCYKTVDVAEGENPYVMCSTADKSKNFNCNIDADYTTQSEYLMDNYIDELHTFKHTFKISGDNYYWVSTERED